MPAMVAMTPITSTLFTKSSLNWNNRLNWSKELIFFKKISGSFSAIGLISPPHKSKSNKLSTALRKSTRKLLLSSKPLIDLQINKLVKKQTSLSGCLKSSQKMLKSSFQLESTQNLSNISKESVASSLT